MVRKARKEYLILVKHVPRDSKVVGGEITYVMGGPEHIDKYGRKH